MNRLKGIEFNNPNSISGEEAMEIVENEGAIVIHNFLHEDLRESAVKELKDMPMFTEHTPEGAKVERKQNLSERFGFAYPKEWPASTPLLAVPPRSVHAVAEYVADYANQSPELKWSPNEIIGHEYIPQQFLRDHRDYEGSVGRVAVATLYGMQEFHVILDNGDIASVNVKPGTVSFIRGYQGVEGKPRPIHGVREARTRRLAISIREMTRKKLPEWE